MHAWDPDDARARRVRSLLRVALPLAAAAVLLSRLGRWDWNRGPWRAGGLAVAAALLAVAWRWRPRPARGATPLLAAAAVTVLVRLVLAAVPFDPHRVPVDIGETTAAAVVHVAGGGDLYAAPLDPTGLAAGGPRFAAFKYGPVIVAAYGPLVRALGSPLGLYATNAVLLALVLLATCAFAWRVAGAGAALAAAFALLSPSFVRTELFQQGVNDLVPALLALGGVAAACAGRPLVAGLALGLSTASKLLPAPILLPLVLVATPGRARVLAGFAVGLLALLPDALATPQALLDNLVLFHLGRGPNSTGVVAFLPAWAQPLPPASALAVFALVLLRLWRSRRAPADLLLASAVALAALLAGSKAIHRNYLFWWLPLAAAAFGVACFGRHPDTPGRQAARDPGSADPQPAA